MSTNNFNLDFRPASYWQSGNGDEEAVSRIKGTHRRCLAREILDAGDSLPPGDTDSLFAESLSDEDRDRVGRIHPALMGGEYLPDLDEDGARGFRPCTSVRHHWLQRFGSEGTCLDTRPQPS
jgi:hypothetical protein